MLLLGNGLFKNGKASYAFMSQKAYRWPYMYPWTHCSDIAPRARNPKRFVQRLRDLRGPMDQLASRNVKNT